MAKTISHHRLQPQIDNFPSELNIIILHFILVDS